MKRINFRGMYHAIRDSYEDDPETADSDMWDLCFDVIQKYEEALQLLNQKDSIVIIKD